MSPKSLLNPRFTRSALPLAALLSAATAQAADTANPVVVTATRLAQTIDQSLAPVTLIDRQTIDKSPATSLPELLALQPGVDITQSGGHGATSSVFLRGTNSGHVLVLIDGVRIGSATLGQVAFQDLPLAQIEKIEIVRGPRSSLYGSDAIGGVIQIFTRKGEGELKTTASAAYGTHDSRDLKAGIRGGDEQNSFSLNLGHYSTKGIDARTGSNPDRDGYRNNNVSASYQRSFSDDLKLDLSLLRTDTNVDIDTFSATDTVASDGLQQALGSTLDINVNDSWDLKLRLSESRDESNELTNGTPTGRFNTRSRQYELQSDSYLSDSQILTLGANQTHENITSSSSFAKTSRSNDALFGQWQNSWGAFELMLGLRSDDHESFGRHNTGNINTAYHLNDNDKLLLAYGTAFHAPTFNDLYFPSGAFGAGNPNLLPEQSRSWELGYEHLGQQSSWAVRAFTTKIENLIVWQDQGGFFFVPVNVGRAEIDGLELEWQAQLNAWQLRTSASFLDARDADTQKVLPKRAEKTLQVDLSRQFGKLTAGVNLLAQGHRYSNTSNSSRQAGYGITNLKLSYALDDQWAVSAKVNNLFDRQYATNGGFNSLDRTLMIGLDYGI